MKEIKLTQGQFAILDDDDFDYLNQWKWCALKCRNTYYAVRRGNPIIRMHRVIMNTPKGMDVDHRDHNGLNNQKSNLRNCTRSQNIMNKSPYGKSKYLGVSFVRHLGKKKIYIIAQIETNNKRYYLGIFKTEEDAARAYDKKAIELHGEFANLNFKSIDL